MLETHSRQSEHWLPDWTDDAPDANDLVLLMHEHRLLCSEAELWHRWADVAPYASAGSVPVMTGYWQGQRLFVASADPESLPQEYPQISFREALLSSDSDRSLMLSGSIQIWHWSRDHRFCGRCGQLTDAHPRERARWCNHCQVPWYPRLAPCVITLVRDGDRLLLARSVRTTTFFSLIAGFIEPGESAEQAVIREVREEVGLEVDRVRYMGSQPWPFPHQLMLGFTAELKGGELRLQPDEIAEAGWFSADDVPTYSSEKSIAGQLIRHALDELRARQSGEGRGDREASP